MRSFQLPGLSIREFSVSVPLDWNRRDGREIELFAREMVDPARKSEELPLLLYLEGGPGGSAPRPLRRQGWIEEALREYRIVFIDQRGTGRSHRLEADDLEGLDGAAGADLLSLFRADSMIQDFEYVRTTRYGARRWALLGQSYGGFLALSYLSFAEHGVAAAYVCGGIPGTPPRAEEVYRRTYNRVRDRTHEFYQRFPGDEEVVAGIADRLAEGGVRLPDGDVLSVKRFQSLGMMLGMGPGRERLHWLLESTLTASGKLNERLSSAFLQRVMTATSSAEDPLFWVLQENIYADTETGSISWAAQAELSHHPEFADSARPLLFTAEMTFEWMFDEVRLLRGFAPAVRALSEKSDWPALYEPSVLASSEVPLAAAVYYDDIYVDSGLQLDTLNRIGNAQAWVTNEFQHDGISSGRVFTHLRDMIKDNGGEHR